MLAGRLGNYCANRRNLHAYVIVSLGVYKVKCLFSITLMPLLYVPDYTLIINALVNSHKSRIDSLSHLLGSTDGEPQCMYLYYAAVLHGFTQQFSVF